MKVLMVNGSAKAAGCTFTALTEGGKALNEEGVDYEIFGLGAGAMRDCIGCGKCSDRGCIFDDDAVNEFLQKAREADGFVFGSPVYYAHPSGRILSFLDRAFYAGSRNSAGSPFAGKPGAAVVSARRGGTTASLDVLNKYFTIASMPVVGSSYWNMVHGSKPEDVLEDKEGIQTMRNLGRNMAWMLKHLREGFPSQEKGARTNFIR